MSTIYWFETLDAILFLFFIGTVVFLILGGIILSMGIEDYEKKLIRKGTRIICIGAIFLMGYVFTPSTKTAYKIVGIGGTIDYLKDNDTAKQLPDKCIKALDMLLEKQMDKIENDTIK